MPGRAFAEEKVPHFARGIVQVPRPPGDNNHRTYWPRTCAGLRASAPDAVAAFEVVATIVRDGALGLHDGGLPDYRTPEIMRSWAAQAWPLGKQRLSELDAATSPIHAEPYLWWDAIDTCEALAGRELGLDEGMERIPVPWEHARRPISAAWVGHDRRPCRRLPDGR